ncbi:hypothetical protein DFR41_106268 [Pseudacidovorax intermedius]|uniref:Uncharacterized protein n=1 Tax=Pseudacidovorax intermedius TaxID=433924 RepID=A0A370FFT8_9BURK|nr:hypothetical protein [Pseudacidovorax intermedius]RDI23561.1 hypothetical protein DFR41_106268 [Pseudacidovorax intermedius]
MILTVCFVLTAVLFFISAERSKKQQLLFMLISLCFSVVIYLWGSLPQF